MSRKTYRITSERGAEFFHRELGEEFEHDLAQHAGDGATAADVERAVVAAGWVEPADKPSDSKKKGKEG